MTDNRAFPALTLAGVGGYSGPREGMDVLNFVGPSMARFKSVVKKFGEQPPHNPQFQIVVELLDDDCRGKKILGTKPVAGTDKSGASNARNLCDMLASAKLYTIDQLREIEAAQAAGTMAPWDPDQVIAALLQAPQCAVYVGASYSDDGAKPYSNIDNFILQSHDPNHPDARSWEKIKSLGEKAFRQDRPPAPSPGRGVTATVGGGVAPVIGNFGGATGVRPTPPGVGPIAAPRPAAAPAPIATAAAPLGAPASPFVTPGAAPVNAGGTPFGGQPFNSLPPVPGRLS